MAAAAAGAAAAGAAAEAVRIQQHSNFQRARSALSPRAQRPKLTLSRSTKISGGLASLMDRQMNMGRGGDRGGGSAATAADGGDRRGGGDRGGGGGYDRDAYGSFGGDRDRGGGGGGGWSNGDDRRGGGGGGYDRGGGGGGYDRGGGAAGRGRRANDAYTPGPRNPRWELEIFGEPKPVRPNGRRHPNPHAARAAARVHHHRAPGPPHLPALTRAARPAPSHQMEEKTGITFDRYDNIPVETSAATSAAAGGRLCGAQPAGGAEPEHPAGGVREADADPEVHGADLARGA